MTATATTERRERPGGGARDATTPQKIRLVLEEVKFLQKQRERKSGIPTLTTALQSGAAAGGGGGGLTKVKKWNSEESSTQWTTGIAEIQLPKEYKLKNIEETEAANKLLQEKRLMGRTKSEFSIPSSYSADYFQRSRDYAEKLRRNILSCTKTGLQDNGAGPKGPTDNSSDAAGNRQAVTDQFMLKRFCQSGCAKIYEERSFPKGITVQQLSENTWVAVSLVGL
ncbi:hypothetical protein Q3G72_025101 [Acer saccharum]|nr:hypothetical protein Q3G72_025101 [Acer saccharum]